MDEKLLLQLAQMMGGPNGQGVPLRDEAVGMLEAKLSGVPVDSNDGRNRVKADEMTTRSLQFDKQFYEWLKENMSKPRPTPVPGIADQVLSALVAGVGEAAMHKWRTTTRRPLRGSDPEGWDTRPKSPDVANASGGK